MNFIRPSGWMNLFLFTPALSGTNYPLTHFYKLLESVKRNHILAQFNTGVISFSSQPRLKCIS